MDQTYFGVELGAMKPNFVSGFPYNCVPHPMIVGSMIGLLGFQCKCEYYFCAEHRYSDKHECAFDFKTQARKSLEKQNPVIAPSKMETM